MLQAISVTHSEPLVTEGWAGFRLSWRGLGVGGRGERLAWVREALLPLSVWGCPGRLCS